MRLSMVIALTCALGCATPHPPARLLAPELAANVDALVAGRPLAADANLRSDELERTPGASVHLVQVRGGETPHVHAEHDLVVTVLRGEGVLRIGGAERVMRAGDVAVVPRGVRHRFRNRGDAPAVAIAVFAPPLASPDNVPMPGD